VLSTPEDDYFEYDLLKIDRSDSGEFNKLKDHIGIFLIYFKYKWVAVVHDFDKKTGIYLDFKWNEN
jgi:hypothetical protein